MWNASVRLRKNAINARRRGGRENMWKENGACSIRIKIGEARNRKKPVQKSAKGKPSNTLSINEEDIMLVYTHLNI